jgi:selenocysteine-specific elongation factor
MATGHAYLLIFCGLPASGKTTITQAVARHLEENGISTFVVSSDDFRGMVSFSPQGFKPQREETVKTLYLKTIMTALENGFLVISDDLNYYKSMRNELRAIAKKAGASYDIVFVDTPVETAIEWNRKRGEPIPSAVIEEVNQKMDPPSGEYKWDTAIATVDPSKQSTQEAVSFIVDAVLKKLKTQKKPAPTSPAEDQKTVAARSIERETRKAMMEVMKRYKTRFGAFATKLRKSSQESVKEGLRSLEAVTEFLACADEAAQDFALPKTTGLIPVHVGLFGHVDHGKTMLARRLTEKASTAALDKAPDSVRRGMTLDMGFSAFTLGEYLVTLVDLPGHYSLVKHAVAGANIIDAAVLVVAADEGLQIQSIEHFSIIKNLGIKTLTIAINKVAATPLERVEEVKKKISLLLKGTPYEDAKIVCVSGLTGEGISELKTTLQSAFKPPVRQWVGPFKMPIDHAFTIAGTGTVLTGTIHRGKIQLKDAVQVAPVGKSGQVRSIRSFGEEKQEAITGERVGLAVKDIKPNDAHRGYVACSPGSVVSAGCVLAELEVDKWYKRGLSPKSGVTAFVGPYQVLAEAIPCEAEGNQLIVKAQVRAGEACLVYLKLKQAVVAEKGDHVLLLNSGLPAQEFRVIGGGKIREVATKPQFYAKKTKTGIIVEAGNGSCLVRGLFASAEAALRFVGKQVFSASQEKGEIASVVGSSGDVAVKFEQLTQQGNKVFLVRYKKLAF